MAVTWKVGKLDVTKSQDGLTNVVISLHWRAEDSETVDGEVYTAERYGLVALPAPDSKNFTEYSKITKESAIAWLKAVLGAEAVTNMENSIASEIASKKEPATTSGVPW